MSTSPAWQQFERREPLTPRLQSKNNSHAIRLVPYSPPRLNSVDGQPPSQASSHDPLVSDSPDSPRTRNNGGSSSQTVGESKFDGHASSPGSVLTSALAGSLLPGQFQVEGVSGPKPPRGTSGEGPRPQITPDGISSEEHIFQARGNALLLNRVSKVRDRQSILAAPSVSKPRLRNRNFIAIHGDKTFSLVRQKPEKCDASVASPRSPPLSYSSKASTSQDRTSLDDTWSDIDRSSYPSSPPSTIATVPESLFPGDLDGGKEGPIGTPFRNHHMLGGIRKVPADTKQKQPILSTSESPLAPLLECNAHEDEGNDKSRHDLAARGSIASAQTFSTTFETPNYKVYGQSSPAAGASTDSEIPPSSPNYVVFEHSSPLISNTSSSLSSSPLGISSSDRNYIVHGNPSPSPYVAVVSRKPRSQYSNETLTVAPLQSQAARTRSNEKFGYYKQRLRESSGARTKSIPSIRSFEKFASVNEQESKYPYLAPPTLVRLGPATSRRGRSYSEPNTWSTAHPAAGSSSRSDPWSFRNLPQPLTVQMIESHPHQWSDQLSTVMSESEGGSEQDVSRSATPISPSASRDGASSLGTAQGRRSSIGRSNSKHRRQSSAAQLEYASSLSSPPVASFMGDAWDRPQATYARAGLQARLIHDHDEDGDGLGDLHDVLHQTYRAGLSNLLTSGANSTRSLRPSASSSSLRSSIPAWAKVYYGSGERKWLGQRLSISTSSSDTRPESLALHSSSPSTDLSPVAIYSPRKRGFFFSPRELPLSNQPAPPQVFGVVRTLKRRTSSIWSPHLRLDRRASRYSLWEPPSVNWSVESGILGRRNAQVVLFIVGFVFPFAWMIAGLLKLPPNPKLETLENGNESQTRRRAEHTTFVSRVQAADEIRYESARWWRNLNRWMSVLGVIIIVVVTVLLVTGSRRGWMSD